MYVCIYIDYVTYSIYIKDTCNLWSNDFSFQRGQLNDRPTFRVQDYSWDDHGYSLVNRLYNDVGNLLDEKFKTTYNLTYLTMGTHSNVDTSRFRRAIWNYIQCMFGIRHDDYDYNEVNQLLERSLKTFIKNAVCYPELVTKRDYDRVMREFKHSEKVGCLFTSSLFIALLVCVCRFLRWYEFT